MAEFIHAERLHDAAVDVEREGLARLYAEAAMAAAGGRAEQDALMSEMEQLKSDVLDREPKLIELFSAGQISDDEKVALVDRIFAGRCSTGLLNTMKVMAKHGRLGIIRDVIAVARKLWETQGGRVPVDLETAAPMEPELEQEVLVALAKVLGADPIVYARVNPDLIAGFIVRVGDRVYDGSTRTRLEKMRGAMIERARNAIQTNLRQFAGA